MMHYRKGENVEHELTKEELPFDDCLLQGQKDFLWMKVKGGTKVNNVISFAKNALDKGEYRTIMWSGSGGGLVKTVSCAEIMKRSYTLYQLTRMCYTTIDEHWKPQMDGLEEIVASRKVPCLHILMSLDAFDDSVRGVQKPNEPSDLLPDTDAASTSSGQKREREGQPQRRRQRQSKPKQLRQGQEARQENQTADIADEATPESQSTSQRQQHKQQRRPRHRQNDGQQQQDNGQQHQVDGQQRRNEGSQRRVDGDGQQRSRPRPHGRKNEGPQQRNETSQQVEDGEQQQNATELQQPQRQHFKPRRPKPQHKRQQEQQQKTEQASASAEASSATVSTTSAAKLEPMDTN